MKRQPEELNRAIQAYKDFWSRLSLPPGHRFGSIKFDGSLIELSALGYCDYEWGHPNEDDEHLYLLNASLIWSQVVVANTEFEWGDVIAGQYSIECVADEDTKCVFFPYQRLLEVKLSRYTQFDDFGILIDVLAQHLLFSGISVKEGKEFIKLSVKQEFYNLKPSAHHVTRHHSGRLARMHDWVGRHR